MQVNFMVESCKITITIVKMKTVLIALFYVTLISSVLENHTTQDPLRYHITKWSLSFGITSAGLSCDGAAFPSLTV